ncbi:hypothetical protein Pmani_006913 [Petrolisthes manimaculis]|uniref:CCHC-type domain-containing protein n=1 Tax=Petrolisthes manimaculis TaxID=1843537 RepID=A0AAE1Q9E1_9EUCA|nr:hypothetical protein Pmani_006913 [Petrolisthes manimaculis]
MRRVVQKNVAVSQSPFKPVKTCGESKGNFKLRTCYLCGKAGHLARDCWSKQRDVSQRDVSQRDVSQRDVIQRDVNQRGKPVALVSKDRSLECDSAKAAHRSPARIKGENDQCRHSVTQSVALLSTMRGESVETRMGSNVVRANNPKWNCGEGELEEDPFVGNYDAFLSEGLISCGEYREEVTMLRDSGALQSLLLKEVVPVEKSGKTVLVNSLWGLDAVPLVTIHLESELFSGSALVGVVDQLPVPGVQFILGNDLAGGKMGSLPVVSEVPVESKETEKLVGEIPDVFPVCAITRSMTARKESEPDETEMKLPLCEDVKVDLSETFLANLDSGHESREEFSLSRENLIEQQKADSSLQKLFDVVDDEFSQFYITNGILMRRWKPQTCNEEDAEWRSIHQIVVPQECRGNIWRRKRKRLCHINMLKEYHGRDESDSNPCVPVCIVKLQTDVPDDCMEQDPAIEITEPWNSSEETTIGLEQKLEEKLSHLNVSQKEDFTALLLRYPEVFRNTPGYTNMTTHDVDTRHPQSQGSVERANGNVKRMLYSLMKEKNTCYWVDLLKQVQWTKNIVKHRVIAMSPYEAVFGQKHASLMRIIEQGGSTNDDEGIEQQQSTDDEWIEQQQHPYDEQADWRPLPATSC